MSNTLHFSASTNLKNLLGKDLVTDQFTAVFELVKNSYDADATKVRIEFSGLKTDNPVLKIIDNGIGMDLDDVENKWMIIGTESKKYKSYSEIYNRPLNGEKGIGRFSVDRLGSSLILKSIKKDLNKIISVDFNWNEFEKNYDDIQNISIPYNISDTTKEGYSGVVLEIGKLRDQWDIKAVDKLIKNLRQFKSPFSIDDDFSIIVHAPDLNIHNVSIQPYNLGDISSLWVQAEIPVEDATTIKLKVVRDGIEHYEEYKNTYQFGPIKTILYFFDSKDKISFHHRIGMRVKDFGNIRLYRDNFRIHPYGEPFNDWLDLDIRKAQGFARSFGSRDLVGYVQIYKKYNSGIVAPTNRQGIVDNEYSKQLRQFIIDYPVKILEKYYFKKPKNESFTEAKNNVETAVQQLTNLAKEVQKTSPNTAKVIREVTKVITTSQSQQTQFVRNQNELLDVYKRVASKEILLQQIIHQALIRIENVKTVSSSIYDLIEDYKENIITIEEFLLKIESKSEKIDSLTDIAKDFLKNARDHIVRQRTHERINLRIYINRIAEEFKQQFIENRIMFKTDIQEDIFYTIDKNDIHAIVSNFLSNSIKSLKIINDRQREIIIKIVQNPKNIVLVFKDNGVGIPEHLRDRIFDPFFTTTDGFGMGLSIVDEIVKFNNGELNLSKNYEQGAEFQVKFRR